MTQRISKVLFSISSLNIGGAERQFIQLVKGLNKNLFDVRVVLMYKGTLESELDSTSGIQIYRLEKKSRYDIYSYMKYISIINEFSPNVIYSFLPDLNVISVVCKFFSKRNPNLFWGIRAGTNEIKTYSIFSQVAFLLQKLLSRQIKLAVFNSYQGQKDYLESGFRFKNSLVISNGMNSERFKPDKIKRSIFREKYNLSEDDVVIGIVSRFEYVKGMDIFASSASTLLRKYNNLFFFSIGYGDESIIRECKNIVGTYIDSRFFFLGKRNDPENIMPAWDIYCSTSRGEGFSNSIAEAMLCGLPVIASDVGDSSKIIGSSGMVFESSNVNDLCNKIELYIDKTKRINLVEPARLHITEQYSVARMIEASENAILTFSN
jgi:glycosyltransferase involved in cell wall biosynthesis